MYIYFWRACDCSEGERIVRRYLNVPASGSLTSRNVSALEIARSIFVPENEKSGEAGAGLATVWRWSRRAEYRRPRDRSCAFKVARINSGWRAVKGSSIGEWRRGTFDIAIRGARDYRIERRFRGVRSAPRRVLAPNSRGRTIVLYIGNTEACALGFRRLAWRFAPG